MLVLALLSAISLPSLAADPPASEPPSNEQVIVPQIDRRDVKLPRFPSNDFEGGLFTGTYSTENFGASWVKGVRLGYHVTEDVFVEAVYGQTKVSDENFREILPGGIFTNSKEKLSYYNLSAGFNVLPGEVFFGRQRAMASALYLIGGVGTTQITIKGDKQRQQTFNVGLGLRVFLADWAALQVDMRDHIFSLDLLGKRQSTQNLELTAGVTVNF